MQKLIYASFLVVISLMFVGCQTMQAAASSPGYYPGQQNDYVYSNDL